MYGCNNYSTVWKSTIVMIIIIYSLLVWAFFCCVSEREDSHSDQDQVAVGPAEHPGVGESGVHGQQEEASPVPAHHDRAQS